MRSVTIGPFNRVEGDLEVHLDVDDGRVASARVNAPLYRGFEQILAGKSALDALVITPRICGICSVSQSMAAAYALRDAMGLVVPRNGELATNLILANENVADHFTHFYLFFMPDFARATYAERAWHSRIAERFRAISGTATAEIIPARSQFLHLMGTMAGKWPHTLTLQPGGSTRAIDAGERIRLLAVVGQFRRFMEHRLFGDDLERIVGLDSERALDDWRSEADPMSSDFRAFLHVADDLGLSAMGRATDRFMSYGSYPIDGKPTFARGLWDGERRELDPAAITEETSHSWMAGPTTPHSPFDGVTQPDMDRPGAYTWCKSPRVAGQVVEVGALARQVVDGHPLAVDLARRSGGNVRNRVVCRLLEAARVTLAMEEWLKALRAGEPYCSHGGFRGEMRGLGLSESARGSLGHWIDLRDGNIVNYQIVSPTTWNFSPRDARGVPGALEQALVGLSVPADVEAAVGVQHVVRSFDPCMVCTVH